MAHFDENNPQYRFCCKKCHVKTGALIIGVLELIYAILITINGVRSMLEDPKAMGNIAQFLIALAILVVVVLMIIGVIKVKKNLIIPHLVWQILFILVALTYVVLALVAYFGGGDLRYVQGRSQEGGRGNFKLVMIQSSHRFGLAAPSPNLSESSLAGGL